jgi:hypothetical protein
MLELVFDNRSSKLVRQINEDGGGEAGNKLGDRQVVIFGFFGATEGANVEKLVRPIQLTFHFLA